MAAVEAFTLLVLLVNVAAVHLPGLAAGVGPVHGSAYLIAIALALSGPFSRRSRMLTFIPGIGALLAVRQPPDDRESGATASPISADTWLPGSRAEDPP